MLQITGILKSLETGKYYVVVKSENVDLAGEVKEFFAKELLNTHHHHEKETDVKNQLKEWEFLI